MRIKLPLITSVACMVFSFGQASPPGTAFTYQGRLNDGGNPANGNYVFRFSLDDGNNAPVGTRITTPAVNVSNGLFTVMLDFGPGIFTDANRRLNLEVHTNDNVSPFVLLTPPQPIRPTPYAIYAATADAAGISGIIPASSFSGSYNNAVNLTNVNNTFAGNGTSVTNVNAVTLGGLSASNFWQLGGNAGTTAGTHFLGTTDNQPLEVKVNGLRALRIEINGDSFDLDTERDGAPNLIGGSPVNFAGAGVVGATVAGGGATNYDGSAYPNTVLSDYGVVGGGLGNHIASNSPITTISGGMGNSTDADSYFSAIGGGWYNTIAAGSFDTTIAGGYLNAIGTNSMRSAIGGGGINRIADNSGHANIAGGLANSIGTNSSVSAIGGGDGNHIASVSQYATIAGGLFNQIAANSAYATIPGGRENVATNYAFAAGRRAKAIHTGAFVWADSSDADFASTTNNQFAIRAQNGVMIQGTTTALDLRGDGAIRVAGAGVASSGPVFIHRAMAGNISGHITTIDHPLANGDPNAILLVTHNYSADTSATPYEPNTVGVWYNGSRWTIYHENTGVAMPEGRAFNVLIIKP